MFKPKKILVPTDFSPLSEEAISTACDLVQLYGAKVTLLHVFETPAILFPEGALAFAPEQTESLFSYLREGLITAKKKAEAASATPIEIELIHGRPVSEIVRVARDEAYDLLVMGSHGQGFLEHALLGSVTERVLRKSPCHVLVVRESRNTK